MSKNPTIGSAVHFVLATGAHRHALVHRKMEVGYSLTVFLDPSEDLKQLTGGLYHAGVIDDLRIKEEVIPFGKVKYLSLPNGTLWIGQAKRDVKTKSSGTWHWPEDA